MPQRRLKPVHQLGSKSAALAALGISCLLVGGACTRAKAQADSHIPSRVVAFGTSLTAGSRAENWPSYLQALTGYTTVNQGWGGESSTSICIRQGGCSTSATVVGEIIPTLGSAQIAFATGRDPVANTLAAPEAIPTGFLCGVHGRFSNNGTAIFVRDEEGPAVPCAGMQAVTLDMPYRDDVQVIDACRNNYADLAQCVSDVSAMKGNGRPGTRFFTATINADVPGERMGEPLYERIKETNAAMQSVAGDFIDVWTPLLAVYDRSNRLDVLNHQHGVIASSLRASYKGRTTSAIDSPTTCSFTLGDPGPFVGETMQVDDEYILLQSAQGKQVTGCIRGYAGSLAVAHASGTAYAEFDVVHLNGAGYKIWAEAVHDYLKAHNPQFPSTSAPHD